MARQALVLNPASGHPDFRTDTPIGRSLAGEAALQYDAATCRLREPGNIEGIF
jgi:hypothetical protein